MRRQAILLLTAMVAASLVLLANPPQAVAATIQQGCGLDTIQHGPEQGYKKYAQSFKAAHRGKLTRAQVYGYGAGTYTLEIWAASRGLPTGSGPLASTTVFLQLSPGAEFGPALGTFATPARVAKDGKYALVVEVPDANNNGVMVRNGNPCPGAFSENKDGTLGQFALANKDMEYGIEIRFKRPS